MTYLWNYTYGLLRALVGDPIVTSLFVGCVALAIITQPLVAVAVFFVGYAILRTINTVANAIGNGLRAVAQVVNLLRPPPK